MRIVELRAENIKRLECVEIKPDGNLVVISGKNGAGKTSVLDSIWWALSGAEHVQVEPIRKGQAIGRIRLDLGEIVVTRTFRKKPDGVTTSITVEGAQGARFPSPQRMLDSLLGELSFDPLAFARMKPREQFDQLRRFVPGVDFEAIENANRGDFERRTELNRFLRQEHAAAQAIVVPLDTPEEPIDEAALITNLEKAGEQNADIERRRANRRSLTAQIEEKRSYAAGLAARAADLRRRAEEFELDAGRAQEEATELQRKLEQAPPLPEPINTGPIRDRIKHAQTVNNNVRLLDQRMKHHKRAEQLQSECDALTAAMKEREQQKRAAIAAAQMPLPGLELDAGGTVLLNGLPFEQASDAEQLRASVAIAAALNPKLRVIRIRDGSLLDEDSMQLLAEMAEANDMQIWVERVDSSGTIGFVLEDGHARRSAAEQPQAVPA